MTEVLRKFIEDQISEQVNIAVKDESKRSLFAEAFEEYPYYAIHYGYMPSRSSELMDSAKKMFRLYNDITGSYLTLGCRPCYNKVYLFFSKAKEALKEKSENSN